jgi:hypothetical protein
MSGRVRVGCEGWEWGGVACERSHSVGVGCGNETLCVQVLCMSE